MKRLLQNLLGGLLLLAILSMTAGTACGEELSGELMVLPRQANIVVSITYETEIPDITLVSPDGTAYSEADGNVRVDHGEKSIYYYLPDALAGQWLIRYDKKSNPAITADYGEYTPDLTIGLLHLDEVLDGTASIRFRADYPENIQYNYVVCAVLLDENRSVTGRKELDQGNARSNEEVNRRISLRNLSSFDAYYLELEVYYKEYGLETFDTRLADQSFEYVNSRQPEAISGLSAGIEPAEQTLTLDWTDYKVSCDRYLAAFYTAESPDTPLSYQTFESGITSAIFDLPPDAASVVVELVYQRNGVSSAPYRRQISWGQGLKLSIDTPENTNSVQALVTYETDVERSAAVMVNDSQQQVILKGRGSFSVNLEEYANEVTVRCALDDMTDLIFRKSIYSDRIAPVFRFYENVDAIFVKADHFLLTGETEYNCVLTVNGVEYPLESDGTFKIDLPLPQEKNIFAVVSRDPAGNQSAQSITIYHGENPAAAAAPGLQDWGGLGYLPLFFSMIAGMTVVLVVILSGIILGKRSGLPRGVTTTSTLRNTWLALTVLLAGFAAFVWLAAGKLRLSTESLPFLSAARRSPQDAYDMLTEYETFKKVFFIFAFSSGFCLLVAGLLTVINRMLKKGISEKEDKPQQKETFEPESEKNILACCPHCGRPIGKPNARFCTYCGKALQP